MFAKKFQLTKRSITVGVICGSVIGDCSGSCHRSALQQVQQQKINKQKEYL